jgi:cytochrome bd-type quinol oxidase subunit 1
MGAYLAALQVLRQRTPIGMRHGLALLQQTKGDVAAAEALFQQELTQLVAHQAQVPEAAARHALERADYEVPRALQQLEQQRYSLTQRILRRYRDPTDAVRRVADALEQTYQVPRSSWLDLAAAQRLLPPLACVLVVNEWLVYEDWEGLAAAVYFQLEVVLAYCDHLLLLPQVSHALRHVAALEQAQAALRDQQLIRLGVFSPGPEVAAASAAFDVLRPRLVQRLYELIKEHIELFP